MKTSVHNLRVAILIVGIALFIITAGQAGQESEGAGTVNQVLEWNQNFIDTLIADKYGQFVESAARRVSPSTPQSSTRITGFSEGYVPVFVDRSPPRGASRRAAVIAAAYSALVGIFPSLSVAQREALNARYVASLTALSDQGGDDGESRQRGIDWGTEVAKAVLAWRATDGFTPPPSISFVGGSAVGQWRPTGGIMRRHECAGLGIQLTRSPSPPPPSSYPGPPRSLASPTYADDLNSVKALGRNTGSTRSAGQSELAPFWQGNASVHWNQATNQIARANRLSISASNRLLAVLNIAMADTALTIRSGKWHYGPDFDRRHMATGSRPSRWRTPTAIRARRPTRAGCPSSTRHATQNILPATPV